MGNHASARLGEFLTVSLQTNFILTFCSGMFVLVRALSLSPSPAAAGRVQKHAGTGRTRRNWSAHPQVVGAQAGPGLGDVDNRADAGKGCLDLRGAPAVLDLRRSSM